MRFVELNSQGAMPSPAIKRFSSRSIAPAGVGMSLAVQIATQLNTALLLILLAFSGCTDHLTLNSQPTTQRTQTPISTLYSTDGLYTIKPDQRKEILQAAEKVRPRDRDIWLILVDNNRIREGDLRYEVVVYFTPDEQSARVRKGRCVYINNYPPLTNDRREQLERAPGDDEMTARLRGDHHWPMLLPYIQVSPASQHFGDDRSPPSTLPNIPFAPLDGIGVFSVPRGQPPRQRISDSDLIAIMDAANSVFDGREWARPNERVHSIEVAGDFAQVVIEAHGTPPHREGTLVTIRRGDGGFKSEGFEDWME